MIHLLFVDMYSGSEGCAGFAYIEFIASMTSNYINMIFGLLSRSYPKQLITDAIEKAKVHSRADLLSPRQDNSKQDIIPFVHTYNPRNIAVTPLISEINQILQNDRRTKDICKNTGFINKKTSKEFYANQPLQKRGTLLKSAGKRYAAHATIRTKENALDLITLVLISNILNRSYPKQLITDAIEKAKGHS